MELRHLRTFLTVADTLNISAAARQLRVTQPALSRQIQDLEHTVGRPLFLRHPGGLRLTSTGATLRERGGKAVAAVDDALRFARGGRSEATSELRVGYYGSIGIWSNIMVPAAEKLARKYPQVHTRMVEMSCGQLPIELREGRLDVALLGPGAYDRMAGIAMELACTVPALAMMPADHRLAKKRQISLEDLRDEVIVGLTEQAAPGRYRSLIARCQTLGFTPHIIGSATGLTELIMDVKQHMGIAIAGSMAMGVPHPGVVFLKIKPPGVLLELYAAHATSAGSAASELAALIVKECGRLNG